MIIKLKKKFKDTVPICVKKHTKIEAELLHNKEPLYMSGQLEQLPVFQEKSISLLSARRALLCFLFFLDFA